MSCKYCDNKAKNLDETNELKICKGFSDNEVFVDGYGHINIYKKSTEVLIVAYAINFCPMCGGKL